MRTPEDSVVVLDLAIFPFLRYLEKDWVAVEDRRELEKLERSDERTWVLYTFPTRVGAVHPRLWTCLEREYRMVGRFEGTVRGGDVFLLRKS